jgi:signal transduction histidine kinase
VRLRQVLVNLLSNAVKYNRQGGQVRVSWQVDERPLRPVDRRRRHRHGAGEARASVRAVQPPRRRELQDRGTGIGLVLSRRLVELMQGELRIASALGRGTQAT